MSDYGLHTLRGWIREFFPKKESQPCGCWIKAATGQIIVYRCSEHKTNNKEIV